MSLDEKRLMKTSELLLSGYADRDIVKGCRGLHDLMKHTVEESQGHTLTPMCFSDGRMLALQTPSKEALDHLKQLTMENSKFFVFSSEIRIRDIEGNVTQENGLLTVCSLGPSDMAYRIIEEYNLVDEAVVWENRREEAYSRSALQDPYGTRARWL